MESTENIEEALLLEQSCNIYNAALICSKWKLQGDKTRKTGQQQNVLTQWSEEFVHKEDPLSFCNFTSILKQNKILQKYQTFL